MQTCTRPIGMLNGKYVFCGKPASCEIGFWFVCEDCKPIAEYYKKKYGEDDDKNNESRY